MELPIGAAKVCYWLTAVLAYCGTPGVCIGKSMLFSPHKEMSIGRMHAGETRGAAKGHGVMLASPMVESHRTENSTVAEEIGVLHGHPPCLHALILVCGAGPGSSTSSLAQRRGEPSRGDSPRALRRDASRLRRSACSSSAIASTAALAREMAVFIRSFSDCTWPCECSRASSPGEPSASDAPASSPPKPCPCAAMPLPSSAAARVFQKGELDACKEVGPLASAAVCGARASALTPGCGSALSMNEAIDCGRDATRP